VPGPAPHAPATPNALTGKPAPSAKYAARTLAHCESVVRGFYDFHLEAGSGPMVNPFPLARLHRARQGSRHRNPMEHLKTNWISIRARTVRDDTGASWRSQVESPMAFSCTTAM
jgi:hypothetical protein